MGTCKNSKMRACCLLLLCSLGVMGALTDTHSSWDRILREYVSQGSRDGIRTHVVNYTGIRQDPGFALYIDQLAHMNTSGLTKNPTYALYMNAYNALAIKMVLDHPCKHDIFG